MQILHANRVCKNLQIKTLVGYHDLHAQTDTLLLDDVFENFRNMCLEIYKLDPVKLQHLDYHGKQLYKRLK